VTSIIVTHNGRNHVEACLRSLALASERAPSVLVVDNGSADDTVEIVRQSFPTARLLTQHRNLGYGCANNAGARLVDTEYIAVINQDIVSVLGWLDHLVDALDADQSAALATPMVLLRDDPDRVNACGNAPHYTGITVCRGYNLPAARFERQEEVAAISGAAFLIRRSVFESLGGFDSLFFLYLEDTDLSLRAALAGHRCLFVPSAVVFHAFEPHFSLEKLAWLERHRHAMLLKLYRWRTLVFLAPALLLAEVVVVGYSVLRGPRGVQAKLAAYLWVASHLGQILDRRRQAQAQRRLSDGELLARMTDCLDVSELGHPFATSSVRLANQFFRAWHRLARAYITW
jgi:GT2 family glycosyltransferase